MRSEYAVRFVALFGHAVLTRSLNIASLGANLYVIFDLTRGVV